MDSLKKSDFWLIWSMALCGLAYPIVIIFAFAGYFSVLAFEWVIAICIFCLLNDDKGKAILMLGLALFIAGTFPVAWYFTIPIALLLVEPMLTIYENNCLEE